MNWFTGIIVYVLVWWVALFAILPLWVAPAEPGDLGHAAGAPKQPLLRRKVCSPPLQGYRICILPNWARRRVRKVSSKAARMRFPFMDPLEPSSLARFRARRRSRAIFCGL